MSPGPSPAQHTGRVLRLLLDPIEEYHVSLDTIAECQNAMRSDARVRAIQAHRMVAESATRIVRGLARLHAAFPGELSPHGRYDLFVVLMSVDFRRCLPYFVLPGRKSVYLMDAWPGTHESIKNLVRTFSVKHLFLSSSVAVRRLAPVLADCQVAWIPEAIDPTSYHSLSWEMKDIDVLQLGRRFDQVHEKILSALEQKGKQYLYEKVKGELVFATRGGFVDGLARTKISICVPSSITHPELSGDIEVLSMRYLQSMVSKCLVVGHAPAELTALFGYNPVVELDMKDPAAHILALLGDHRAYEPLIERNYETVVQRHTWHHRWEMMSKVLFPDP